MPAGERTTAAYEHLREWIVAGELSPGAKISQLELTRRLGVSRTPLREALRLLTRDGLVEEAIAHRQVRISAVSMSDLDELYATRLPMEAMAISRTIPQLTVADVAAMRADLRRIGDPHTISTRDAHRRFHAALWQGTGDLMRQMLWTLLLHAERYQMAFMRQTKAGVQRKNREHVAILTACEQGDRDGARDALVDHLANTALTLMEKRQFEPRLVPDAIEMIKALPVDRQLAPAA